MTLNICVPIQIKSNNLEDIRSHIECVKKYKPNYIEFRLDYINNISLLSEDFLKEIVKLSQDKKTRVILTYRTHSEGGQAEINEKDRLGIVKKMIIAFPDYIDLEMRSSNDFITDVVSLALQKSVKMIFSYHDFVRTPPLEEITRFLADFDSKLLNKLSINANTINYFPVKFIFTAQHFLDNLVPIKLAQELSKLQRDVITFCMGELGIFSRVSCVKYGALFTFASIGDKTAPGQISLKQMREVHRVLYNI
ncbi:MAG: type I 3-dehydroquinate dehydratase [Candidatus Lokiarchaeota archaeon]|nr:type I 3-dehydroquinate dehydratase [Candidatus Lokiarchaeota archaeon]